MKATSNEVKRARLISREHMSDWSADVDPQWRATFEMEIQPVIGWRASSLMKDLVACHDEDIEH